ncbi:hypothetical protein LTR36_003266 [Oleoguttula mirabilis]|uniref:Uncharacterized protein n=1 Tax=Oleoguttula mirabilis TaxID=1507867 RepID=A0AAV9JXI1_9PEZI|nr:hypothetical protein LTR36_003266 [Oleoguttula mirabilis]
MSEKKPSNAGASSSAIRELGRKVCAKRNLVDKPLFRRGFAEYIISHAVSGVSFGDDETLLFADNSSCVLQSEVTQGPYYVDGELIRNNVVEDQIGFPLYLDMQLIDTSICEPLPAVFVDFWHCDATGVQSGIAASSNGDDTDTANLDKTFLRGIQPSDVNGVVQIETIVPEDEATDPIVEYVRLSDAIPDGILAWISVDIDPTSGQGITSVATHYADGGVVNADSGSGGGGGGSAPPS